MAKLEIVNNKREIKKALKECIEKYPNYESIEVYTWLNDCFTVDEWDEENDKAKKVTSFDGFEVMIFFCSGVKDENSKCGAYIGNKSIVWKKGRSFEHTFNPSEDFDASYREDKAPQLENEKVMRECYKSTIELHDWAKALFGDRVQYPKSYLYEGQTEWLIYD